MGAEGLQSWCEVGVPGAALLRAFFCGHFGCKGRKPWLLRPQTSSTGPGDLVGSEGLRQGAPRCARGPGGRAGKEHAEPRLCHLVRRVDCATSRADPEPPCRSPGACGCGVRRMGGGCPKGRYHQAFPLHVPPWGGCLGAKWGPPGSRGETESAVAIGGLSAHG